VVGSKTNLFCKTVRIGHSKSSKVVDFGTNRNGVCDFLLVINFSNFGPIFISQPTGNSEIGMGSTHKIEHFGSARLSLSVVI